MTDTNTSINHWFTTAKPNPNAHDICVQLGAMCEEMAELLRALGVRNNELEAMSAKLYNANTLDDVLTQKIDPVELLDAMCDVQVTMQGVANYLGLDYQGALAEVNRSNWSKFENQKPVYNAHGKIAKGKDYTPPNLKPFTNKEQV